MPRKLIVFEGDFNGCQILIQNIIRFFETGLLPMPIEETKEIYAVMNAFQKSKATGEWVDLETF